MNIYKKIETPNCLGMYELNGKWIDCKVLEIFDVIKRYATKRVALIFYVEHIPKEETWKRLGPSFQKWVKSIDNVREDIGKFRYVEIDDYKLKMSKGIENKKYPEEKYELMKKWGEYYVEDDTYHFVNYDL